MTEPADDALFAEFGAVGKALDYPKRLKLPTRSLWVLYTHKGQECRMPRRQGTLRRGGTLALAPTNAGALNSPFRSPAGDGVLVIACIPDCLGPALGFAASRPREAAARLFRFVRKERSLVGEPGAHGKDQV
ncbi:hypothetical protein [Micromonospora sp. NPDC005806]|uniref:hypothetical protein n=1 Tax=Micromonospora sp. NPDC005806 TaxID=3364234 RepID=UPI00367ADE7D